MNGFNYTLSTLFEFAIPTKGAFANVIGHVVFGDYETKVMTKTADTVINGNTYSTVQGYILVKPLADQFKKLHSEIKLKAVGQWAQSNRKVITRLQEVETEKPLFIAIEGSKEIQGTYFRPDVVLLVLEWLCPAFKTEFHAVYQNYIVEQNAIRQAQANNPDLADSQLTTRNVRFMEPEETKVVFSDDGCEDEEDVK
jgi:hypothetical protein